MQRKALPGLPSRLLFLGGNPISCVVVARRFFALWLCLMLGGAAAARADEQLPEIVVTGAPNKNQTPPDVVMRDRVQRSPDIHWPSYMPVESSEIFAHNEVEINASCTTVWSHLVQAELWAQWWPKVGAVKIMNGSPILQKNSWFTWSASDLPMDSPVFNEYAQRGILYGRVVEYVSERRLGWYSHGPTSFHGVICVSYHNVLIAPDGAKKCRVTFEEVATGAAARYARGACPELTHVNHERWLLGLKKISEGRLF